MDKSTVKGPQRLIVDLCEGLKLFDRVVATQVNLQAINMPLIKFLLIMINMVNLHITFGENLHVFFVV